MKKNVKSIDLLIKLKGHGCVNFDKLNKFNKSFVDIIDEKSSNNIKVGKGNYYFESFDNYGNPVYRKVQKISAESIKKNVFDKPKPSSNRIINNIDIKNNILSDYTTLLGGYMKTEQGLNTFKKKSVTNFTDFEVIDKYNKINTEIMTNSNADDEPLGKKDKKENDPKSIKMRFEENTGDVEYSGECNIDIKQLQFICADVNSDMYFINPDEKEFELFKKYFKENNNNNENIEIKKYRLKNQKFSTYDGVLLSSETIVDMVKFFLKQVSQLEMHRLAGNAIISEIKLRFNDKIGLFKNKEYDITITSEEDIDNINFEPFYVYEENV